MLQIWMDMSKDRIVEMSVVVDVKSCWYFDQKACLLKLVTKCICMNEIDNTTVLSSAEKSK